MIYNIPENLKLAIALLVGQVKLRNSKNSQLQKRACEFGLTTDMAQIQSRQDECGNISSTFRRHGSRPGV